MDTSVPIEKQIELIWSLSYLADCDENYVKMHQSTKKELIGAPLIKTLNPQFQENYEMLRSMVGANYILASNHLIVDTRHTRLHLRFIHKTHGLFKNGHLIGIYGNSIPNVA